MRSAPIGGGRESESYLVKTTQKFSTEMFEPAAALFETRIPPDIRPLVHMSFGSVLDQLGSNDGTARGLALEAIAIKLMRLIDMSYVVTRRRGTASGGAEAILIFESHRLVFPRWQVHSKNTPRISLDEVATAVGLTYLTKSRVVVIVGNGRVSEEARAYASAVTSSPRLCIIMIDRDDLECINANPTAIADVLNREARDAMTNK